MKDVYCPSYCTENGWSEYKQYVLAGINDNKNGIARVEKRLNDVFFSLIGIGSALIAAFITIILKG